MGRVTEILHSSSVIEPKDAISSMKKTCKYAPLVQKLGHMKEGHRVKPVTMAELMDACNRHAATDKTQDDSEEEKGKGAANNGGKNNGPGNNNNSNQNQHKRGHQEGNSELVANANAGFQRQRMDGNYQENRGYQGIMGVMVVEIVIKEHDQ